MMAVNTLFSRRPWSEDGGFGFPRSLGEEAHVLAVDDSIVDRKVIEKLLKIYSCKVTAVDSVKRALQFLGLDEQEVTEKTSVVQGLKVDLIITDYSMPELTGYELLKRIKESSAFREIPVVIMSSENVLARIDRCLEEGAEDFIVKPVKLSDMERLKQHLAAKDVSKSKARALSTNNKRKQPDAPDLNSSESPPSIASPSSGSPVSLPSSGSPVSSPSSGSSDSSPSKGSLVSSPSSGSPVSLPSSGSLVSSPSTGSSDSSPSPSPSPSLLSAASPLLPSLSPDLQPPIPGPLDLPSIKLKSMSCCDVIRFDSAL